MSQYFLDSGSFANFSLSSSENCSRSHKTALLQSFKFEKGIVPSLFINNFVWTLIRLLALCENSELGCCAIKSFKIPIPSEKEDFFNNPGALSNSSNSFLASTISSGSMIIVTSTVFSVLWYSNPLQGFNNRTIDHLRSLHILMKPVNSDLRKKSPPRH